MLNVTRNCYRQNVTDSDSNVTQNAYANSNSVKHQRSNLLCCVLLRLKRCVNCVEPVKSTGICGKNIVFYKPSGTGKAGIVKILSHTVAAFVLRRCVAFVAHHFAFTFLNFEFERFAVWRGALNIRVSLVRFQSRPPFRTVVLLCSTAVFLFPKRKTHVTANATATLCLRCCDFAL